MQSHNLQFLLSTDANVASIRTTLSSKLTIITNLLRTCLRPWTGCYQCKGEIEKILSVTEGICGRSKILEIQGQQGTGGIHLPESSVLEVQQHGGGGGKGGRDRQRHLC